MSVSPARPPRARLLVPVLVGLLVSGCSSPAETGRWSATLITQNEHTVESGQTLLGDTLVAGGEVLVDQGAEHRGSLTVLAGQARIEGHLDGDLTVLGGSAVLADGAEITGDLAAAGGAVTQAPGAVVRGSISRSPDPPAVLGGSTPTRGPVDRLLRALAAVAVVAALAWLAARVVPRSLGRTQDAALRFPVVSGALGALVLVSVLPLVASMVFTLFLIPLAGIVLLGLAATTLYGLVALGQGLAGRVLRERGQPGRGPVAAALGTAVLVAALQVVALVPVVGVVMVATTVVVALGAAFLTGFGLRPYVPPDDAVEQAVAADEQGRGPAQREGKHSGARRRRKVEG